MRSGAIVIRSRRRIALCAATLAFAGVTGVAGASAAGTAVTIGDTGTPTGRLAADAVGQALTAQGYTVTRTGYPTTAAADAAVRSGAADAYAAESATLLERTLARPKERNDARLPALLAAVLAGRGQSPSALAPADDAPQVACTRAAVRTHKLRGLLALPRPAANLTYAATPAHVTRADGLPALRVTFRRVVVRPGTARFDVIGRRRAHCVLSSGTEPRAARMRLTALRDGTRRLAGTPQRPLIVTAQGYLAGAPATFGPTVDRVMAAMTGPAVTALRTQVELDGLDSASAAQAFLRAAAIIP